MLKKSLPINFTSLGLTVLLTLILVNLGYLNYQSFSGKPSSGSPETIQIPLTVISCANCEIEETIASIAKKLTPNLKIKKIDITSTKGKALKEKFNLTSVPAFVLGTEANQSELRFFLNKIAEAKENEYLLNLDALEINSEKHTLKLPVVNADDHAKGPANASITIIEYSDFECPYCERAYSDTVKKILANYGNQVRFVFKNFPLDFHEHAQKAAEASECAGAQGKFWEMHNMIFENQKNIAVENLKEYAQKISLNTSKFDTCLDSGATAEKIKRDIQEGISLGVTGTPVFFVNDVFVGGAYPYEYFDGLLKKMLK